jgi:hypothetical protein
VEPETTKIELVWHDGGTDRPLWVSVKQRLTVGETRAMMRSVSSVSQAMPKTRGDNPEPTARIEWTEYSFARMGAYITDWSLAHDPEPSFRLPVGRRSFEALQPELFELIDNALDEHQKAMEEAKKQQAGSSKPEPTPA